ncbi:MAG: hypothetical protein ACUVV5_11280, partial [Candidatus Aminicenantales bacterium]
MGTPDGSCLGSPPALLTVDSAYHQSGSLGDLKRSVRRGAPEPSHPSGALAFVLISWKIMRFCVMGIFYRQIRGGLTDTAAWH